MGVRAECGIPREVLVLFLGESTEGSTKDMVRAIENRFKEILVRASLSMLIIVAHCL